MNYYQAREMKDEAGNGTGRWHYTVRNDDVVMPIGYCADGCPGHDTADEARAHFRQFVLDTTNYATRHRWGAPRRCRVCNAVTTRFVLTPYEDYVTLCPAHANRAGLAAALPTIGDAISST